MATAPDLIVKLLSEIVTDFSDSANDNGYLGEYDAQRIATRARAAIGRYAPPRSSYEGDAAEIGRELGNEEWRAKLLTAIVHALRDDYALGGLTAVQELVHADLFDDFLDMAAELLSKGFVGPAAALAG